MGVTRFHEALREWGACQVPIFPELRSGLVRPSWMFSSSLSWKGVK